MLKEREWESASRLSAVRSQNLVLEWASMGCPVLAVGAHLEHTDLETGNQAQEVLKSSSVI